MRTKVFTTVLCLALVLLVGGVAFAQDAHGAAKAGDDRGGSWQHLGLALGFGLAIAAAVAAFSQSRAISAALESVARQPEAGGRIQTMMLIGVVFIETLVIFTWVLFFLWGGVFIK